MNGTVTQVTRAITGRFKQQWPHALKLAQMEYDWSVMRATTISPFEALFGRKPPDIVGVKPRDCSCSIRDLADRHQLMKETVRDALERNAAAMSR